MEVFLVHNIWGFQGSYLTKSFVYCFVVQQISTEVSDEVMFSFQKVLGT